MTFLKKIGDQSGFYVQAVPNAAHDRIMGIVTYQGQIALKVAVSAPAIQQKANVSIIKFLAQYLDISRSQLSLEKGHTGKLKSITCSLSQQELREKFRHKGWIC